jgi:hypothetical protein
MSLDTSGNLLVGTTTPRAVITSQCDLAAKNGLGVLDTGSTYGVSSWYGVFFNNVGTVAGSIQHTASTTVAYATSSDNRLKENITYSSSILDKLNDVKVRAFDWKDDKHHTDYGFIAQELYDVFPEAVGKGDDAVDLTDPKGTWQVEYGRLTPMLLKAIQEQQALITNLTSRLEALEGVK